MILQLHFKYLYKKKHARVFLYNQTTIILWVFEFKKKGLYTAQIIRKFV